MQIKDKKNKRIKISNIDDLNKELKLKGYNLEISDFDKFKEGFIKTFNISNELFNKIYKTINEESISYKVILIELNMIEYQVLKMMLNIY